MNRLTRQEQLLLCIVMATLLTGWAVSAHRAGDPSETNISDWVKYIRDGISGGVYDGSER